MTTWREGRREWEEMGSKGTRGKRERGKSKREEGESSPFIVVQAYLATVEVGCRQNADNPDVCVCLCMSLCVCVCICHTCVYSHEG